MKFWKSYCTTSGVGVGVSIGIGVGVSKNVRVFTLKFLCDGQSAVR